MLKKWASFLSFVNSTGSLAIDGVKRMESLSLPFSVESFRNIRLLKVPKYQKEFAIWLSSSIKKMSELDKKLLDLAKEQTIEWLWREGNPFISPEKVADEGTRRLFSNAVTFNDVKVNLPGRWCWKEEEPNPPWEKITPREWL